VQPRLGHQRQQPHRLQTDGLSAGVGAGDDQHLHIVVQDNVNRHHALRVEQGVARADETDVPTSFLPIRGDEFGSNGPESVGVSRLGEGQVQFGQRLHGLFDLVRTFGDEVRKVGQDAIYLLLFLKLEFAPGVVQFDDGQRFDKERHPRGGAIVDDALEAIFKLGLEGNDVAALALRDERLLQVLGAAR